MSYCQICAFHPNLNLNKIVIFCNFQQTEDKTYYLNNFSEMHLKYFAKATFKQLRDSATNVLNKIKSTSLLAMFSTELQFTIDVLVKWFIDVFQSRFNKVDELKKTKIYKRKSY